MIKNKEEILEKFAGEEKKYVSLFLEAIDYLLLKIDLKSLIKEKLKGKNFSKFKKIYVVGCGKATYRMAEAIEEILDVTEGEIIIPDNEKKPVLKKIGITYGSHPLPNENGIIGAQKILEIAKKAQEEDLVISLISGGGSSLMVLPAQGVSLEEKIDLTSQLMKKGANIYELNTVRKHLSEIKGGKLMEAIYPANALNIVVSDVIGDDLSVIASGPLVPDNSTFADAQEILRKYGLKVPKFILEEKEETPKSDNKIFANSENIIVANHQTLPLVAEKYLRDQNIKTKIFSDYLCLEAKSAAIDFIERVEKKEIVYLAAGETTVKVHGKGYGGRNQEFVLAALRKISEEKKRIVLLSFGSDGVDGFCPKSVAGAVCAWNLDIKGLSIEDYLENNDSYNFFERIGSSILTGPTGINLGDLVMAVQF